MYPNQPVNPSELEPGAKSPEAISSDAPEVAKAKAINAETQRLNVETSSLVDMARFAEALKALKPFVEEAFDKCGAVAAIKILGEMSSGNGTTLHGADFINEFNAQASDHINNEASISTEGATAESLADNYGQIKTEGNLKLNDSAAEIMPTIGSNMESDTGLDQAIDEDMAKALNIDVFMRFANQHSLNLDGSMGSVIESVDARVDSEIDRLQTELQTTAGAVEQGSESAEQTNGSDSEQESQESDTVHLLEEGIKTTERQIEETTDEQEKDNLKSKLGYLEESLALQKGKSTTEYYSGAKQNLSSTYSNIAILQELRTKNIA